MKKENRNKEVLNELMKAENWRPNLSKIAVKVGMSTSGLDYVFYKYRKRIKLKLELLTELEV